MYMADSTTPAFESFRLDGTIPIVESEVNLTKEEMWTLSFSNQKQWDNYSNRFIYECDKFLRSFLEANKKEWSNPGNKYKQRFTFAMIFKKMFGRDYDVKKDAWCYNQLDRIIRYYSVTTYRGAIVLDEKTGKRKPLKRATVYALSASRLKLQPYSLKLRIEQMVAEGIEISPRKLRVPKDNLPTGHSRNPKTEENKNKRKKQRAQWWEELSEEEKERWREEGRKHGQKANQKSS